MNFEKRENKLKSEQMLEENYPDLIICYEKEPVILYCSNNSQEILGYPIEEFIGHHLVNFFEVNEWLKIKQFLQREKQTFFAKIKNKQGHYIDSLIMVNSQYKIMRINLQVPNKKLHIEQQKSYLSTLFKIQKQLLLFPDQYRSYNRIVQLLGECSGADRVYIFENHRDESKQLLMSQKAEFCAVEITPEIDNPRLQNLSYQDWFPRWKTILKKGEIIFGLVRDFPVKEREILEPQNILSILIIPIIFQDKFWGFIGFDHCKENHIWGQIEIELLTTVATGIALALERKEVEQAFQKSESKYTNMFDNISLGIFQTSLDGRFLNTNRALAKIYGYDSPEELITNIKNIEQELYLNPDTRRDLISLLKNHNLVLDFETQVYRKDGSIIWISENIRSVYNDQNQLLYYEGTVEDITARRVAEERLLYGALHDALTGLPNRSWFMNKLKQVILLTKKNPNYNYAMLFIDLDSFKVVNDSLGHLVGDELLKKVSTKFQECLNQEYTIARFGGDEFAILLDNINAIEDAIKVAENIKNSLQQPILLKNYEIFVGTSIGITSSIIKYQNPEDILRDADVAMYQAKGQGKGNYAIFNPEIQQKLLARLELESYLRRAIELKELQLYYQPIICLKTGKLIGFEALVRWQHPKRGFVSPTDFIPIAEETGLIKEIGWWVFCEACQQLKQWQNQFSPTQNLIMNINLSAYQLREIELVEKMNSFLIKHDLKGENLKLEITETCFLETLSSDIEIIKKLKKLGLNLCIDDFGTGYSSLSRLHEFPIDTLKIDRAFINSMDNKGGETIILTILTLAHTLGMNVVAEGIETTAQLEQLKKLGCEYGQGYLFSRPLNKEKTTELIAKNLPLI